jgi:hypothetical protein
LVVGFAYNHISQQLKAEKTIAYIRQNKKRYSYSSRDSYYLQYNRPQQDDRYNNRCNRQYNKYRKYNRLQQDDHYNRCRNEQYDECCNRNNHLNKCLITDDKGKGKERDPKDKPKVYIIDSDSEVSIVLFCSSSFVRSIDINRAYIVRDTLDFHSGHCKLGYSKSFRSIEAKAIYKNNKTYIKAAKFEARKEMFTLAKRIYCICEVPFKSYNKLFRHFKNGYVGTTSFAISPKILPSETSSKPSLLEPTPSEPSSPDLVHQMLDIPLLTLFVVPMFK